MNTMINTKVTSTSTSTSMILIVIVILSILSTINGYKTIIRSRISMSTIDITKKEYGKKIVTDASKVYNNNLIIILLIWLLLLLLLLLYNKRLQNTFWDIDQMTKQRMDKIISLYEKERIDPSAFHGVNGIIIYIFIYDLNLNIYYS